MGALRKKGLSQRRSCHLAGIARTVARYQPSEEDERLIKRIKELAFQYIRYGYRRIWALLRREGLSTVVGVSRTNVDARMGES